MGGWGGWLDKDLTYSHRILAGDDLDFTKISPWPSKVANALIITNQSPGAGPPPGTEIGALAGRPVQLGLKVRPSAV